MLLPEIGVAHIPDAFRNSVAISPEAVLHSHLIHIEVSADVGFSFINNDLDLPVSVLNNPIPFRVLADCGLNLNLWILFSKNDIFSNVVSAFMGADGDEYHLVAFHLVYKVGS